jgi:hypothetical protein
MTVSTPTTKSGTPPIGTTLDKIGRTTGWTYGSLVSTCETTTQYENGYPTGRTLLCQNRVNAKSDFGDSGSPVFSFTENGYGGNYELRGILWGGNGTQFLYSPIENIQSELGCLRLNNTDYTC